MQDSRLTPEGKRAERVGQYFNHHLLYPNANPHEKTWQTWHGGSNDTANIRPARAYWRTRFAPSRRERFSECSARRSDVPRLCLYGRAPAFSSAGNIFYSGTAAPFRGRPVAGIGSPR